MCDDIDPAVLQLARWLGGPNSRARSALPPPGGAQGEHPSSRGCSRRGDERRVWAERVCFGVEKNPTLSSQPSVVRQTHSRAAKSDDLARTSTPRLCRARSVRDAATRVHTHGVALAGRVARARLGVDLLGADAHRRSPRRHSAHRRAGPGGAGACVRALPVLRAACGPGYAAATDGRRHSAGDRVPQAAAARPARTAPARGLGHCAATRAADTHRPSLSCFVPRHRARGP